MSNDAELESIYRRLDELGLTPEQVEAGMRRLAVKLLTEEAQADGEYELVEKKVAT